MSFLMFFTLSVHGKLNNGNEIFTEKFMISRNISWKAHNTTHVYVNELNKSNNNKTCHGKNFHKFYYDARVFLFCSFFKL